MRRSWRRPWIWVLGLLVVAFALAPSYVRAYRVHGPSDAPSLLWGDLVLANRAAYDLRLPYTGLVLARPGDPAAGDVVLVRQPERPYPMLRRVVAVAGATLTLRRNRLVVDGRPLDYEELDASTYADVAERNRLGSVVESERLGGRSHAITYTPGQCSRASHGPLTVPAGHYFLLGDNRDHCTDSRMFGPVPRERILGKVVAVLGRGRSGE